MTTSTEGGMVTIDITHDGLVKQMFGDLKVVAAFIRWSMPNVAKLLDLERIESIPTETFGRDFRKMFKDLAFKVPMKQSGRSAYIYVLIEHKSRHERFAILQTLRYVLDVYYREALKLGENDESGNPTMLAPVLPVLFTHGKSAFDKPIQFAELIDACPELEPFVPKFQVALVDMMACPEEELPSADEAPELYAMASLMQSVFREKTGERLVDILLRFLHAVRQPYIRETLEALFLYGLKYTEGVTDEQVQTIITEAMKLGDDKMPLTAPERWIAEGEVKGEVKASQDAIIRFLKARRYEISDGLCEKLRAIQDIEKLQQLTDLAATTESIADFESKL